MDGSWWRVLTKRGPLEKGMANHFRNLRDKAKMKSLSHVRLFATPWTIAHQAPLSMGFSRQEYRSGLPFPSPRDLPNPGIKPGSPTLWVELLPSEPPGNP